MTARASQTTPRRSPRRSQIARDASPGLASEDLVSGTVAAPPAGEVDSLDTIELVTGQGHQGTGFAFRVQRTGGLFRCQVMRNPNQPRFWCITIFLCLDGGSPDTEQPRWLSTELLTREEMHDAVEEVKADVAGWLSDPSRANLCSWVLTQTSRSPVTLSTGITA